MTDYCISGQNSANEVTIGTVESFQCGADTQFLFFGRTNMWGRMNEVRVASGAGEIENAKASEFPSYAGSDHFLEVASYVAGATFFSDEDDCTGPSLL